MRKVILMGLCLLGTAGAQLYTGNMPWQRLGEGKYTATDDSYRYLVTYHNLGAVGEPFVGMHQVSLDNDDGVAFFCNEFTNLGIDGNTLLIEHKSFYNYFEKGSYTYKTTQERLAPDSKVPVDMAFDFPCGIPNTDARVTYRTLHIPNGASVRLPMGYQQFLLTMKSQPDLTIRVTGNK